MFSQGVTKMWHMCDIFITLHMREIFIFGGPQIQQVLNVRSP